MTTQYRHYQTCGWCGKENNGMLSPDPTPWKIGVYWCPNCQTMRSGLLTDRVVPVPQQLTLFDMASDNSQKGR